MLDKSDLSQFTGTEHYYPHGLVRNFFFTDGVKYVADHAGAYWLIDAIASHQLTLAKLPWAYLQFWHLEVADSSAVLTCRQDSDIPPEVAQVIEFTDFPFSIDLWVAKNGKFNVLYLPSEH